MSIKKKSIFALDREIQSHIRNNFYRKSKKSKSEKDADVIRSQSKVEVKSYYLKRSMSGYY